MLCHWPSPNSSSDDCWTNWLGTEGLWMSLPLIWIRSISGKSLSGCIWLISWTWSMFIRIWSCWIYREPFNSGLFTSDSFSYWGRELSRYLRTLSLWSRNFCSWSWICFIWMSLSFALADSFVSDCFFTSGKSAWLWTWLFAELSGVCCWNNCL